jgi:thymidylate kinase
MSCLALEGGVCSGKSTTAELLSGPTFMLLREYMAFLPDDHPSRTLLLSPASRLELFLGIEDARNKTILPSSSRIVADRCIFTIIAFEIAVLHMGHESSLLNYSGDHCVLVPNQTVFFSVPDYIRMDRWILRGSSADSLFVSSEFNTHIEDVFRTIGRKYPVKFIDVSSLTVAQMRSVCEESFEESRETTLQFKAFRELLTELEI